MGEFVGFMSRNKVAVVFINQLRTKMNVMFGDSTTTNAEVIFKYYSSLRIRGRLGSKIKEEVAKSKEAKAKQVGVNSIWETIKNRNIEPFKKIETEILYKSGVDEHSGLYDLLVSEGRIKPSSEKGKFVYNKKRYPDEKIAQVVQKYPDIVNFGD